MNAADAAKNRALLEAINAGKLPKLGASSISAINHLAHIYSPTVNIDVQSGADRATAGDIANAVSKTLDKHKPDSFRKSSGQMLAEANTHLQRAGLRHG